MKKTAAALAFLLSTHAWAAADAGKDSRKKNVLSLELGGRAGLYCLCVDRLLTDEVAVGAGYSYFEIGLPGLLELEFTIIPLYGMYFFGPTHHRGFATAGIDLVFGTARLFGLSGNGFNWFPIAGAGYEYREPGGGFLFRAAGYVGYAGRDFFFNPGLTFGFVF